MRRLNPIFIIVSFSLWLLSSPLAYSQEAGQGNISAGFDVGFSVLTQGFGDSSSGSLGPLLRGKALYSLNRIISLGLGLEWERHNISSDISDVDVGTITTISLIPLLEARYPGLFPFSPYAHFGLGLNINSFSASSELKDGCGCDNIDISIDNTFALRIAGGVEYSLGSNISLNAEIGWKLNSGDISSTIDYPAYSSGYPYYAYRPAYSRTTTDGFSSSVFTMMFGARYYFKGW